MIIGLCSMLIRIYAVYWMFKDTKRLGIESSKRFFWLVFTLFFWYFAVPLYFILVRKSGPLPARPDPADNVTYGEPKNGTVDVSEKVICPKCGAKVPSSFSACNNCGYQLKPQCQGCGRTLESGWTVCPHCGTKVGEEETEKTDECVKENGSD